MAEIDSISEAANLARAWVILEHLSTDDTEGADKLIAARLYIAQRLSLSTHISAALRAVYYAGMAAGRKDTKNA